MRSNLALNILHIEDNPIDAQLVARLIQEQKDPYCSYKITVAATMAEALLKLVSGNHYNVILLDLNLPDGQGIENINTIKEVNSDIPIIVVTQSEDDALTLQALNEGAQEYISKDKNTGYIMQRVIQSSILRQKARNELSRRAYSDDLTDLPNRAFFEEAVQKMLFQAKRVNRKEALMFIDLNKFKIINDSYGHDAGNIVLKEVAERLKKTLRISDLIARYAGDEFVIYIDGGKQPITNLSCKYIAEKIVREVEKPIKISDSVTVDVSLSIGVAIFPDAGETLDIMLKEADKAMYKAKNDDNVKYTIIGAVADKKESSIAKIIPEPSNKNTPDSAILIIDDNKADRVRNKKLLSAGKKQYLVLEAESLAEAFQVLEYQMPDCILIDYYLTDGTALEFLKKYQKTNTDLKSAIIVITGQSDQKIAIEIIKSGAKDYISKQDIDSNSLNNLVESAMKKQRLEDDFKAYQYELERSNDELSEFAHAVAHDLKSPMRKISTFCDMLGGQASHMTQNQVNGYIERMAVSSSRMQNLIDDLLSYSQVTHDAEQKKTISLNYLLSEVVSGMDLWLKENNAEIIVKDLPQWPVYSVKIQQLFTNLITNAVKYRAANRKVVVTISGSIVEDNCILEVADNGIGVPPDQFEKIFMPFQRLHAADDIEGTGLGLSICQKIVEKHAGSISIQSKEGEGSVFTLSLGRQSEDFKNHDQCRAN